MATGASSSPELRDSIERSLLAWLKLFEVPVVYEPDGSVSVGRGDAAVEHARRFEVQMREDLVGRFPILDPRPRRHAGDELVIPTTRRPGEPAPEARPEIRIFRTWRST